MFEKLRALLLVVCLLLALAVLIMILINAFRRMVLMGNINGGFNPETTEKVVDFYATDLEQFSKTGVYYGQTVLVDKSAVNIETGMYQLEKNREWKKTGVPEVGDRFHILRGEYAGKKHTIRPSFNAEIRPPTETQFIDNEHLRQDLLETTAIIKVQPNVTSDSFINVNACDKPKHSAFFLSGRTVTIINASNLCLVFQVKNDIRTIPPNSLHSVHLLCDPSNAYSNYVIGPTTL
jgi:hypothetical protein